MRTFAQITALEGLGALVNLRKPIKTIGALVERRTHRTGMYFSIDEEVQSEETSSPVVEPTRIAVANAAPK